MFGKLKFLSATLAMACFVVAFLLFSDVGHILVAQLSGRTFLVAPLDMYVATTTATPPGAANNPCTFTLPCSSPGAALNRLQSNYDLGGQVVTIHVANGEYRTDGLYGNPATTVPYNQVKGPFVGATGDMSVQVIGQNPNLTIMRPLAGYCFSAQEGDGFFIQNMRCDQDLNTSNPFGPGQDMISLYKASITIDKFIFGDNGAGGIPYGAGTIAPFNDITAVRSTVTIVGCLKPPNGTPWGCWIAFDKKPGRLYQAHLLCDGCYFIQNNNNCVDPEPNKWCSLYVVNGGSAQPRMTDFIININLGVINWGAFVVPQSSYFDTPQCSNRLNSIVFTAGYAQSPEVNYALPGALNSCTTTSGAQVE